MKENYHGRIKNSGAQEVKALYSEGNRKAPKIASYGGNGVKSGFKPAKKK